MGTGAWRGWAVASSVYFFAVMHRTSLGIAGLRAEHRFHIGPAQLSVFVFVQLGVYAAMQVPTGLLVDRFGPRRLLFTASVVMGSAQLLFAFVPSYPAALFARALLGSGDALTFVSVLRFVASRFSPSRYPLLVALTASVGTVGNIVATLPLAEALRSVGWTTTFCVAGLLSLCSAGAVFALLPATPGAAHNPVSSWRHMVASTRAAWALPGTRMGFWVHFSTMSTGTVLGVLWGGVYLVRGAGFSTAGAGAVLLAGVLVAALVSPGYGSVIGRWPTSRVPIGVALTVTMQIGWLVTVFGLGDHPPRPFVVVLFIVTMLGGPASMTAFAIARDYNGPTTLGTASGVVNVGGFSATIASALGVGLALGALGGTTAPNLRHAMLVALAIQAAGASRAVVWYLRIRRTALEAQARGEPTLYPVVRRRWDLAPVPTIDEGAMVLEEDRSGPRTTA